MKIPAGKTSGFLNCDIRQEPLKKGNLGYINGYVRGGNDVPCAVFVRLEDGYSGLISPSAMTVTNEDYSNV